MLNIVNIGILAHVDAGKTSLTERILYEAGVIPEIGTVGHGTTQTDTLELERQRGITIQSAVVSFQRGDRKFNVIDTPGHPDFISEVERALRVLDCVILVVSAVEGVQSQTRRLARVIQAMMLPCMIVVNKIDRVGARSDALIADISAQLKIDVLPVNEPYAPGSRETFTELVNWREPSVQERAVNILSRHDPSLLDTYVECDGVVDESLLHEALRSAVGAGVVWPAAYASAVTGAGIEDMFEALELFPLTTHSDPGTPARAEVFKIVRTLAGERLVIARVTSGTIAVRESIDVFRPGGSPDEPLDRSKIIGIDRFRNGQIEQVQSGLVGDIVRLHGLSNAMIGDSLGRMDRQRSTAFQPPVFESLVKPKNPDQRIAFNDAVQQLADQDPLISLRRDPRTSDVFLRLYGEVQKEVLDAVLRDDYGVPVEFGESQVVYVERVVGVGEHIEYFGAGKNRFVATVGLRVEPTGTNADTRWESTPGAAQSSFYAAVEDAVRSTLREGLSGWEIINWRVSLTKLVYITGSSPSEYRNLAPLVIAEALRQAGTEVCEPVLAYTLNVPSDCVGDAAWQVSVARGIVDTVAGEVNDSVMTGTIPAAEITAFEQRLPGFSRGRGDLDTRHHGWMPVTGDIPTRRRTDLNPFNHREYLLNVAKRS